MTQNTNQTPSQPTILVVEDDLPIQEVLTDKLVREGFTALSANDGVAGLAVAIREHPDLIVLDILMPKMNGLEMMKKLRAHDNWGKRVPIILLTNLVKGDNIQDIDFSADPQLDYLVKSGWSLNTVVDKIRTRLNRSV